jgi:hypothetical protein
LATKRILILADIHCGSTVAPWPKNQRLPDGGLAVPNRYQQYLNKCWAQMLKDAEAEKPDVLVLLGDVVQGVNSRDSQLTATKWGTQTQAAYKLLEPLTHIIPTIYQLRGTEWHEGRGSEHVDSLAIALKAKPHPRTESPTWRRLYLEMGSHLLDFMHHVSTTSIRQYSATAVLRDALNHKLELYTKYKGTFPPLGACIRAHAHIWVGVQSDGIWGVRCPAFQFGTAFTDAKTNAMMSDIGYVIIEAGKRGIGVEQRLFDQPKAHLEVVK